MPRPERKSLAQMIQDDFGDHGSPVAATVAPPESEHTIDSSKISRFFEPTNVQRRRVFEGIEPSVDKAQSTPEAPVIDPVAQAKAQLAGLDDAGLQAMRQAAQEISEERDGDVSDLVAGYEDYGTEYDSLYGWQAPTTTYEEDLEAGLFDEDAA